MSNTRFTGDGPNDALVTTAETIVLALEGRFENLTVGRAIQ